MNDRTDRVHHGSKPDKPEAGEPAVGHDGEQMGGPRNERALSHRHQMPGRVLEPWFLME